MTPKFDDYRIDDARVAGQYEDPLRVLIIEDCLKSGPLLERFLKERLPFLIGDAPPPQDVDSGDQADGPFKSPFDYSLSHLVEPVPTEELGTDGWRPAIVRLFDVETLPAVITEAAGVPLDNATNLDQLRRRMVGDYPAQIIVLDLALGDDDLQTMIDHGGDDDPGLTIESGGRQADGATLRDPRDGLKTTTGFKLLQCFRDLPVIVMTYSKNPLVHQDCLVNGAFSVVHKPFSNEGMKLAHDADPHELEGRAMRNADLFAVLVMNFLITIAADVVKAQASFPGRAKGRSAR